MATKIAETGDAYSPPLAYVGVLPDRVALVHHCYPHETAPAYCGLEPRFRKWHATDVLTRLPASPECARHAVTPFSNWHFCVASTG